MTRPWPVLPLLVSLGLHGVALAVAVLAAKHPPSLAPAVKASVFQLAIVPPPPQTAPARPAVQVANSPPRPRPRTPPVTTTPPIATTTMAATTPHITDAGTGTGTNSDTGSTSAPQPVAPLTPPGYLLGDRSTPMPDYPWSARRRGVEGRVVLRLEVDRDGRPVAVRILTSSGDAALDNAALSALRDWRLSPAREGDQNVAGDVDVPIVFRLI